MKEPYGEGPASHTGPESCGGGGDAPAEALTGEHAGQPLSSEITTSVCRPCPDRGKAIRAVPLSRKARSGTAESETLRMRGRSMHENREIPAAPDGRRPSGRSGKACGRTPDMYAAGRSDIGIAPVIVPNKAGSREVGGHGGTGIPPHN
jgi:RNA-directed DNA polymerase